MPLLEMQHAGFAQAGTAILAPVTLQLEKTRRLAYACPGARAASILAMMAAGIVKPSTGRVYIGAFDPRIQPVQAKRLVGYVPHEAVPHEFASLESYIEYRAALWGLPRAKSVLRADALLALLDGVHEAFAYPLIGALLAEPRLLVFDRPQAAYAPQILAAAQTCAIFSTHVSAQEARRFSERAAALSA